MNFDAAHLGEWIKHVGPIVGHLTIWTIVFAESGLLVGFFLPGDSLLFTAGFLTSVGVLNLPVLALGCFVSAVLGDSVGYWTGNRFGRKLFQKEDSWLFHKKHVATAQQFYDKHGSKAVVLARFVPIVRTFAPIVAGIGAMSYRSFISFNVMGGFVWTFGLTVMGYSLGKVIPDVDKYLLPIILIIIVASLLPSLIHIYQEHKSNRP